MLTDAWEIWRASPLGALPEQDLRRLVDTATIATYRPSEALVREGDPEDHLLLVLQGTAEVSVSSREGEVPLAVVSRGQLLGELALITGGVRSATITALEEVVVGRLDAEGIRRAMDRNEALGDVLGASTERLLVARFIREVSSLASLDDSARQRLADHVRARTYMPGELIIRRGEPGDECFLLRSGLAEIEVEPSSDLPRLRIGPGTLFGEAALVSDVPRQATVRAVEECTVLVVVRDAFVELLETDSDLARRVADLVRLRDRPARIEGIEEHHRVSADAERFVVLKDRLHGRYFQLSDLGWFVWQRLDGTRNVRDLAVAYLNERGGFAPQPIADLLARLARAGFIVTNSPEPEARGREGGLGGFAERARAALTWYHAIEGVDAALSRLYDRYVRFVFTRVGKIVMVVIAIAGLVAFLTTPVASRRSGAGMLLVLIPVFALSLLVHEAGHAFATKAVGREVNRAGFGWFWIGPMAFIDTSDTWLATRRQRLAVALAGPYATVVFAGLLGLVARAFDPPLSAALWIAALTSYVSVFQNLNPLIELDGYYTLVHLLDRPNLRMKALGWLATSGWDAVKHPSHVRGHGFDAMYAVASVLYIIGAATLLVVVYRSVVQGWVAQFVSESVAAVVGWVLAAVYVLVTVAAVVADLRRARIGTHLQT